MIVGYARCSTDAQDLTAQRQQLVALGVPPDRIFVDQGLTGSTRDRPGLHEAMAAASRAGDALVVTKLDRLARSVRDAHHLADELDSRQVSLSIGGAVYNPRDPIGKMLFTVLAMIAEFERDLISQRTCEGLAIARQKGRLKGKPPKLRPRTEAHLVELFRAGDHTVGELVHMFSVSRATVYRAVDRARKQEIKAGELA